jgi:hypothetical protein
MTGPTIFFILWLVLVVYTLRTFYARGKKALSIFPDINTVKVIYRDKTASGHSTKNWKTKIGGARNSLDIVVTDKELWTKSMLLFASIGQQYDLIHKVSLDKITGTKENGNQLTVDFTNEKGELKQIVIATNDKLGFLKSIRR